ncbi:MAG TPA: tetratricopeptide repeat protein, partial [Pyrinomonadaceae bacterium]|nr:tetratricopeptide repeat protein [Pyrinomonadaceae bacterium]
VFGMPSLRHILMLRRNKLLPLTTLFAVDQNSPYYNEQEKSTMFYAQSWALVHYLTHGQEGRRQPQLARFLELLAAAVPVDESFKKAFETDYATLEKELKEYVRQDTYRVRSIPYGQNAGSLDELKSAPITEAEALTYLGDMLLHADRVHEAEKHLLKALDLAPDLSIAQASMGMLRVRQQDFAAAKLYLQRAIKTDAQSCLAQYYYAYALSREGMGSGTIVTSYSPESAEQMRGALRKAIEIAPGFPESYRLLAFVNLVTNSRLDESIELLQHALKLSPGRYEFTYILAQVHMRRKEFKLARAALEQIITSNSHAQLREQARELLEEVAISEKYLPKQ